jgi:hypothetical protein
MSNNYDVRVMWHMPDEPQQETIVPTTATTTALALKIARRTVFAEHKGACIDKSEIVYLEQDTPTCILTPETMHLADDCSMHEHENQGEPDGSDPAPQVRQQLQGDAELPAEEVLVPQPAEPVKSEPTDLGALQNLETALGNDFLAAVIEACEEFAAKPSNLTAWKLGGRKRLFMKIAKIQDTKFTKERRAA